MRTSLVPLQICLLHWRRFGTRRTKRLIPSGRGKDEHQHYNGEHWGHLPRERFQ